MRWNDATAQTSDNRYRYNGKENQDFVNVPYLDYGARMYDPRFSVRWNGPDLLAEKYDSISPYIFCIGNPVKNIDYNGKDVYFMTSDGEMILALKTHENYDRIYAMANNVIDITSYIDVPKISYYSDVEYREMMDKNGTIQNIIPINSYTIQNNQTATSFFEFAAVHSDVEWGLVKTTYNNYIFTSHEKAKLRGSEKYMRGHGTPLQHIHNHRNASRPSSADLKGAEKFPGAQFFVFFNKAQAYMGNYSKYYQYP